MSEQLTIGELFAGYGGLGMAVEEVFNAHTAWQAEWEDAPSKVLAHHWPGVPNLRDVTAIDWAGVEPVDIITGGFPCQDVSLAGRRAGMTEGTRSNLWGAMRFAIETIRPTYVVAENVRGLLSAHAESAGDMESETGLLGDRSGGHLRALGRVLGDLADLGYDTQWCGLRASDVGAPHQRFRVFILATRRTPTDAEQLRRVEGRQSEPGEASSWRPPAVSGGRGRAHTPDTTGIRRDQGWAEPAGQLRGHDAPQCSASAPADAASLGPCHDLKRGRQGVPAPTGTSSPRGPHTDWGPYAPAIHRWEQLRGPAPAPTELTARGKHRLSPLFVEWMMGLPAGWVTSIDISRNDQLKALGNGVVPQQAAAALSHMLVADEVRRAA